jgi:hypothetical protein
MSTMKKLFALGIAWTMTAALTPVGCGDDSSSSGSGGGGGVDRPDETGAACEAPSDCYPDVPEGELAGEALCLDQIRGGYCTHLCESDADCCSAEGECNSEIAQVCSPFESTGQNMCFLSCEDEDLVAAPGDEGPVDEQEFCQREAGRDFTCRSSGGGAANRKICVPGDCGVGAACSTAADCDADLDCVTTLGGGYCTQRDCTADTDCPEGTACVEHLDGKNYCFKRCTGNTDCTLCRGWDDDALCSDAVDFVNPEGTGSVCVPG